MNYQTAAAIAAEHAPKLLVDPFNPALPHVMVVRATPNGMPFSIHIPTSLPGMFQDIPARDAVEEIPAVPATADHPGYPAIPAQPAQPARTIAGQEAESEKKTLIDALDSAVKVLA